MRSTAPNTFKFDDGLTDFNILNSQQHKMDSAELKFASV